MRTLDEQRRLATNAAQANIAFPIELRLLTEPYPVEVKSRASWTTTSNDRRLLLAGFRDINFRRWLRLLTRPDYDLRAEGWVYDGVRLLPPAASRAILGGPAGRLGVRQIEQHRVDFLNLAGFHGEEFTHQTVVGRGRVLTSYPILQTEADD
jgi:hypothetical protein